jgi:hypothetical protein
MQALPEWFALIDRLRAEIWSWMQKHDKHVRVRPAGGACRGRACWGHLPHVGLSWLSLASLAEPGEPG